MSQYPFQINHVTIKPLYTRFYVPPISWKGDPVGHIGNNDTFFWLNEGEAILFVESESYHLKAGQLAFLPKGKLRKYTNITSEFSLYTMAFEARNEDHNLMEDLGLCTPSYSVPIENVAEMNRLFESSSYVGEQKEPIHTIMWSANILNIILTYYNARKNQHALKDTRFLPVLEYMQLHLKEPITIEDLANIASMKPTYFIRRFKQNYAISPMVYLKSLRIHKAMELLLNTEACMEDISKMVGLEDPAYFSRWFKKSCGLSPMEYKKLFK